MIDNVTTGEQALVKSEEDDGVSNPLNQNITVTSDESGLGVEPQTFQIGEIPTVQERYQAVLKRRLQIQSQNHPPLFPWESELVDYPEFVEQPSIASVSGWGWLTQPSLLNLPIPIPEKVFQELATKCQALVTSSLPLGAKLVQAVESLFPDEHQAVNDLAGLVLRSAYRSGNAVAATAPNLQSDYSDLLPRQQMALSLMAARQMLENMTLAVSLTEPVAEKLLFSSVGNLSFKVELQSLDQLMQLNVQAELPMQGNLQLQGEGATNLALSPISVNPGVELSIPETNQTYFLKVEFPELNQSQPFVLVIKVMM
ncbi:PatU [Richelia sinica FACHB-800]|uniref:PatU n=2 Tax=Richelia TaxID=98443 RepID=A0A975T7P5_9NOST|nr:PatU [Richelia sinica FACHB-800]